MNKDFEKLMDGQSQMGNILASIIGIGQSYGCNPQSMMNMNRPRINKAFIRVGDLVKLNPKLLR